MKFMAKARFVRYSPFKLRPLADVVRGKNVKKAIDWLVAHENQRVVPLKKVIQSAVANAYSLNEISSSRLVIKELRVDQGPMLRYFKPGAMGRANVQRKRLSHVSVVLESIKG